ncbi:hypothetical protein [uncultured Algimonas sp.]|uniref:hypothetical protein n=1 Tax=uncultured Algimonas sp. TaxID=1547920 RepID=UPI0026283E0E|nr:hypothetical protein [uncultured Algimonas sp.]
MATMVDADRSPPTGERLSPGRDPVWLCERLGIIQSEAKRARARAVYRSAQDALSLIQRCNVHMPVDWTRVDGRLFVLNKLLNQYEDGLVELERAAPQEPQANADPGPEQDPSHEIAKLTLTGLLPHASREERADLGRLMDLSPLHLSSLDPDLTALESALTVNDAAASPNAPSAEAGRIEWIMPDLVQTLLELGRQYGKTFSVSHTLDDVLIEAGAADRVRLRLLDRLSGIVRSDLPLQGVGRLDISATDRRLTVSGSGFETVFIELPERIAAAQNESSETNGTTADAAAMQTARTPSITDDTEMLLRAQLALLMGDAADRMGD